jgi:hypothetical protein
MPQGAPAAGGGGGWGTPVASSSQALSSNPYSSSGTLSRHQTATAARAAQVERGQVQRPLLSKLLAAEEAAAGGAAAEEGTSGRWRWLGSQRRDGQGRAAGGWWL